MPDSCWSAAMKELAEAQRAFMNGNATGLQALYSLRDDVTVMGGFERGWAEVSPRLAWAASHFHGGDYTQRNISMTVGRDVACLVCVERWARNSQDGRPMPVLKLRVTQTFHLEGDRSRLVHRHADELVEKTRARLTAPSFCGYSGRSGPAAPSAVSPVAGFAAGSGRIAVC